MVVDCGDVLVVVGDMEIVDVVKVVGGYVILIDLDLLFGLDCVYLVFEIVDLNNRYIMIINF